MYKVVAHYLFQKIVKEIPADNEADAIEKMRELCPRAESYEVQK